ncbi:MAG: hypothetical protein VR72_21880 [Clostridiaceae bacterium BRH_c20a]|nr:MAG: hypothetical protein VR72_21880 [Clostridiaceae bacterium BRH_c20a]
METNLENSYKDEYIRTKARFDYEKYHRKKESRKNQKEKYLKSLVYIIWGCAMLYLLYRIYLIFV